MQRQSNLKLIASALFENDNNRNKIPVSSSSKGLPSFPELKRKGESDDVGKSSSEGCDLPAKRKTESDAGRSEDDDDLEFFECEEEDRSKRTSTEPPTKKKNENSKILLTAKVQGPSRLRYWDSADHMAIPRVGANSM